MSVSASVSVSVSVSASVSGSLSGLSPGVYVSVTNDDDFVVKRCVCANRDNIMRQ